MSLLKPSESLVAAAATGALVFGIYSAALPTTAEVRASEPADLDLASAEQQAAWIAAAAVAGISLLAKDPTIFVTGGALVIAFSWWHRHSNLVDPRTGRMAVFGGSAATEDQAGADATTTR